ncbi:MAG: bifunctional (p)ppGpp synthetase/guanosine-3',5'-bis(diphosphate) 3'-pyrophosphohydrolase [Gammaproteobacteria bacterium]|nr:bifunctional (p)ppGpp synthetase/guanosine-3',5'-bis(diphosphate) 3'-pyrophosphohydrolase [Gammaproteobacteria bacterium]MBM4230867.1 bifunctional (p)ppGpp synthetase/guanosine-3',5'-bis(diphosphate) 3'-pyrophosphohydrolase [Gammaproteobacteria bacterium]
MQIAEPISDAMQRALERATSTLHAADCSAERLAEAMPAARLVGALTDDITLAAGVLLHEAAAGKPPDKAPAGFELAAFVAAHELTRLGDFGGQAQWRDGARLDDAQAEVLRKMLLAIVADPRLVVARIGIQLARLRAAKTLPEAVSRRLAGEARAVFGPLANRLGVWQIKWELEDLAFRYLEPEQYKTIASALAERRADRERYIADLRAEINDLLAREGISAEVYGRPKHIFSIHRKMQRKGLSFEQLFDVRAVRIVCASVPDCYAALGVVHGRWTYIPGEFDDYIATPKDNFYRSIHTAVIGPGGKSVEIQIRTREMHEQAELGVAAHWRYKEDGPRNASYERKIEWVRQLLEPTEPGGTANDPDFIDRVRAELFEDRVYALTPRGEVIDLPRGATPLDFAYQVHTSLGHRCRGAKVNGRIVQLTQSLANGQVVEIITGKHESPSRDWLIQEGFLASPRSRAKLRSWFRRVDASENEAAGRALVERELSRLGITLEHVSVLANELKANDSAQLFRWLGEGEISVTQLLQAAARLAPGPARAPADALHTRPSAPAKTRRPRKASSAAQAPSPVKIEGVGDLPMTFAKCCAPVPPEAVLGYVTLGRGVTVHAARCASLLRMRATHPERCLRVDWSEDESATIPVELSIVASDRRGLVRDLSDLVATANLSLESLQTTTDRARGTATTILRTRVRDLTQLADLSRRLAAVDNVISVRRSA